MKTNLEAMDAAEQARQVWAQFAPAILEDWFAGIALKELLRYDLDTVESRDISSVKTATMAYEIAAAMLAERQQRKDKALARAVAEAKKR